MKGVKNEIGCKGVWVRNSVEYRISNIEQGMSNDEVRFFGRGRQGEKLDYEGDEQEEHADNDGGEGDF